jgi:hypothetical protein
MKSPTSSSPTLWSPSSSPPIIEDQNHKPFHRKFLFGNWLEALLFKVSGIIIRIKKEKKVVEDS